MTTENGEVLGLLRLFRKEFGQYKLQIAVLVILSFVSGILEGVGINAVIPLFAFVSRDAPKGADFISQAIEKFFGYLHLSYTLASLIIFVVCLFLIKAVAVFFADYIASYTKAEYEKKARNSLFALTIKADWPYLIGQKIGYLEQRLITDIDNGSKLLTYAGSTIILFANFFAYTLVVVNISWIVAAFTVLFGSAVFLVLKPLFNKNTDVSREMNVIYKNLAHFVNENMTGMKTVKAAHVEEPVIEAGGKYFERMRVLNLSLTALRNGTTAAIQPIGLIFVIVIFVFFYKAATFSFAAFAVIVYAISKVFSYIQQIQSNLYALNALMPYLQSTEEYGGEIKKHDETDTGTGGFVFKESLEFRNVSFAYRPEIDVLDGVSFKIRRGEMAGLIGHSGAGKTTIVDLILRLFMPQRGGIFLDGRDIFDIRMSEWRTNIGYVSQEIFLLNDTVENNIKFYGDSVSKKDMVESARMANILDFINSLPEKFQTVIGERGILLSGGERQRIVLARVLARRPKILILDEATSSLDNESEVLIQRAIENLKGQVTVLAIAHRLSTITASDKLFVLDDGRIIEEGNPKDLLANKDSYFFKVYNLRTT